MKKILFLTGTRADFGKIKSLIEVLKDLKIFQPHILVTGMHMLKKFGNTQNEIKKQNYQHVYFEKNNSPSSLYNSMDLILANTIKICNRYLSQIKPDLVIIHGDRVEPLAMAISASFNNYLLAHIEGGEFSGTIDDHIRHSISKLAHIHFVCNKKAKKNLEKMGEVKENIYELGSPDIDIMFSKKLKTLNFVKKYYGIKFKGYSIFCFHPVTTELKNLKKETSIVIDALLISNKQYICIGPNNDEGHKIILEELQRLKNNSNFKFFPSLRFEYFLVLLKNSKLVIGNSSTGIREAPIYGIPTINLGNRQNNRSNLNSIINVKEIKKKSILSAVKKVEKKKFKKKIEFGEGNSNKKLLKILKNKNFWKTKIQKKFIK